MNISPEKYKELRNLVRAANRRLERASEGQRSALEYFMQKDIQASKWSSSFSKMSPQELKSYEEKLRKFMGTKEAPTISRKSYWNEVKSESVRKANATFSRRRAGHNLTDQEMAEILKQLGNPDKATFYMAVNKVQAMKGYNASKWTGSEKDIANAIAQKWSAQSSYQRALDIRKQNLYNEDINIPY